MDIRIVAELSSSNAKDGPAIPIRFTRLYITLLIILAVLLTVGQGLTQWRLAAVQDELWIIRYAALQRHQSQQIVKEALQLADPNEQGNFASNVAELKHVFPRFKQYHLQVRAGKVIDHQVFIPNSDTTQRLYEGIRPEFEAFERSVGQLITLKAPSDINTPLSQASLKLLLANEKPFLEEMDGIVREYTTELRAKLTLLQSIEFYLYVFTLLVMAGLGLLIFRPAARRIKHTFTQLVEAESQTMAINRKLLNANKSLKETRQKLFEATKQQYQQQIDEQKLRTSYLLAGQEEERKRLSRELHDGLGQMLTAIKLQLEGLETGLTRATPPGQTEVPLYRKNLKTLKDLVTQTIQETRTISNNLMPTVLSDFGIVPAIKMLAESDRSETVDVTFETNLTTNTPRLDKNVEIMLYRVTQEAVSNAVRHANPSHIHIELMEREKLLQLVVSDDGRGFRLSKKGQIGSEQEVAIQEPSAKSNRAPSQGLHNMQERTKLLNGKFKLYSTPGKGTKIHVSIPFQTHFSRHDTH